MVGRAAQGPRPAEGSSPHPQRGCGWKPGDEAVRPTSLGWGHGDEENPNAGSGITRRAAWRGHPATRSPTSLPWSGPSRSMAPGRRTRPPAWRGKVREAARRVTEAVRRVTQDAACTGGGPGESASHDPCPEGGPHSGHPRGPDVEPTLSPFRASAMTCRAPGRRYAVPWAGMQPRLQRSTGRSSSPARGRKRVTPTLWVFLRSVSSAQV